ncbi:DUF1905 domain-containing protein [Streptomyces sp. GZWMJZ-114]|uniref:DUF1905 domain-containing protein n=1 Tax=Streptomyces sp. GZWMJZ-114 TaxID=2494734 RepID=UPI00101356D0|nr:DUF1905 domain-containing protein [Streptomyces sp. GZWMJZ-114]
MDTVFSARVIEWRGPAPFSFLPLPEDTAADLQEVAAVVAYGWGRVPVEARLAGTAFTTSLIPREGGYLLPLKKAARAPRLLGPGDEVTVGLTVRVPCA